MFLAKLGANVTLICFRYIYIYFMQKQILALLTQKSDILRWLVSYQVLQNTP